MDKTRLNEGNLKVKLLLASKSPRRRELLSLLQLPFDQVDLKEVKEDYPADLKPEMVPEYLSKLKASAYSMDLKSDEILVTADTVVIIDNEIIGKPHDLEDAKAMLKKLSGRKHTVVTGVTLTSMHKTSTFSTSTDVTFASLKEDEIDYYVSRFRPLDKAGAYGIQEWIGAIGVESIQGSYFNVMGLPVQRLYTELKNFKTSAD